MIFVSRIIGESYDMNTGKEMPKAIALSNGKEEVLLYVDDNIVQALIQMAKKSERAVVVPPPVDLQVPARRPEPPEDTNVRLNPRLVPQVVDVPEEPPAQDDGPGADYDDPTTGVASL
jgi:hypothetical protein